MSRTPRAAGAIALKPLSLAVRGALLAMLAASIPLVAQAADPAAAVAKKGYSIPAGSLEEALSAFAAAAGVPLSFDPAVVAGKQSRGLQGNFSTQEGFNRLLEGSGLELLPRSGGGYTLRRQSSAMLPEVKVTAGRDVPGTYAGGQVAQEARLGVLGNRKVLDTPFNITSYTSELIENQQAATLADIVENDPSVRMNIRGRGTSNGGGDVMTIRGFSFMNSDASFDGIYGVLPAGTVPLETVERVEVLKGPNALLNGMSPNGGVGGGINIVPKRAGNDPLTRFTATYSGRSQVGGHLDVGRRFGEQKEIGMRFNGVVRGGETAVEGQRSDLSVFSLGLDFKGERVRLSADIGSQRDETRQPGSFGGGLGVESTVTSIPKAPDASARTAQSWERTEFKDTYAAVRAEFDVTDAVTLYGMAGFRNGDMTNLRANSYLLDNAGTLFLSPTWYPQFTDSKSFQAGLRGKLTTGSVKHDWNVSASHLETKVGFGYGWWAGGTSSLYKVTALPKPDINNPDPGGFTNPRLASDRRLTSVAVTDTLAFNDDRVLLTLGLRQQRVSEDGYDAFAGTGDRTSAYRKDAVTPTLGLVVKPASNVSLYANYIEGLSQGQIVGPVYENRGEIFAPIKTRQRELGSKVDFGRLATTFSLFEISQPSAISVPGSTPATFRYEMDGEQRNRGAELALFGELSRNVRVLGGLTYLQAKLTKTENGTNDGKDAVGVPNWMANLGLEWDVSGVPGLTLTGRAVSTSSQAVNVSNSLHIPGWTRWDFGARYALSTFSRPVTLRANLINAFGRDYWESVAAAQGLRMAQPRTLFLSATIDF